MKISVSILGKKIESMIPNKRDGVVTSLEWFCNKCGKKMKVSLRSQNIRDSQKITNGI